MTSTADAIRVEEMINRLTPARTRQLRVDVHNNGCVGDYVGAVLLAALIKCAPMSRINVSRMRLGANAAVVIARLMSSQPPSTRMSHIDLSHNDFRAADAFVLAASMRGRCAHVESFRCDHNRFHSRDGVAAMIDALHGSTALTTLDVCRNDATVIAPPSGGSMIDPSAPSSCDAV